VKHDSVSFPRKRKTKRPYSPEIQIRNKKLIEKRRVIRKQKELHPAEEGVTKQNNIDITVFISVQYLLLHHPHYPEHLFERKF
jgi:hypothetical protein